MVDIAWMTIKVHLGGRAPSMFHAMTIGMFWFLQRSDGGKGMEWKSVWVR